MITEWILYFSFFFVLDTFRVELVILCFLGLDVVPFTFLRGVGHFLFAMANRTLRFGLVKLFIMKR
jgi:hypothetical protein